MKFDHLVDKILVERTVNEGLFSSIGNYAKNVAGNIAKEYGDILKSHAGVFYSKSDKTGIPKIAEEFLEYEFKSEPKKVIRIYGTNYDLESIQKLLTEKPEKPKKPDLAKFKAQSKTPEIAQQKYELARKDYEKNIKKYFESEKDYQDAVKAFSLLRNKELLSQLNLKDPELLNSIKTYLANQKQIKKGKGEEIPKVSPEEVLKSLIEIVKVPLTSNNPNYQQEKLKYFFALAKNGQVVR